MSEPDEKRLDDLQQDIDDVRASAEDHGTLPEEHEQTLADPDGDGEVEDFEVQAGG
jgi:hypothetical protein